MARLTTQVLNIASGTPAAGMRVELRVIANPSGTPITMRTTDDGFCPEPLLEGDAFVVGRYSLTFHAGEYFSGLGLAQSEPPFLDEVVVAFGVADASQNYHVPLQLSPWSYSTHRGS
jgi:5-hydroxyisourate hydrolase